MAKHWFIDGEHAVTHLPTGFEYDLWLKTPNSNWLEHMARKPWVCQESLDELRQILIDHGCQVPECRILSFADSAKRDQPWTA
jgi:hypothetical protein